VKTIKIIEQEVNQIRLKIYEETKYLSSEKYTERVRKIGEEAAKKYGFLRISSAEKAQKEVSNVLEVRN
jgi:hypothetical protein